MEPATAHNGPVRVTMTVVHIIDALNRRLGDACAWLSVIMVLLVSFIVVARALFGFGSLALQEAVTYAHATLFMFCLASTLIYRGHVRVDVFYRRFSPLTQAWIDALGSLLFLLPFALVMVAVSLEFVARAWAIRESSSDPGGLPLVYLLKTILPATGVLLALQAVAEVLRNLLKITYVSASSEKSGAKNSNEEGL